MKYSLVLFILIGCMSRNQAQDPNMSISCMLGKLDNSAVFFQRNYIESIELDSIAKKVCYNIEDSSLGRLVEFLSFPDRVVIAHILLTNLLEPSRKSLKYEYNYNGSVFESTTYTMNSFSWTRTKGVIEVEPAEMAKIKEYWTAKDLNIMKIQGRCGGVPKIKVFPQKH